MGAEEAHLQQFGSGQGWVQVVRLKEYARQTSVSHGTQDDLHLHTHYHARNIM